MANLFRHNLYHGAGRNRLTTGVGETAGVPRKMLRMGELVCGANCFRSL